MAGDTGPPVRVLVDERPLVDADRPALPGGQVNRMTGTLLEHASVVQHERLDLDRRASRRDGLDLLPATRRAAGSRGAHPGRGRTPPRHCCGRRPPNSRGSGAAGTCCRSWAISPMSATITASPPYPWNARASSTRASWCALPYCCALSTSSRAVPFWWASAIACAELLHAFQVAEIAAVDRAGVESGDPFPGHHAAVQLVRAGSGHGDDLIDPADRRGDLHFRLPRAPAARRGPRPAPRAAPVPSPRRAGSRWCCPCHRTRCPLTEGSAPTSTTARHSRWQEPAGENLSSRSRCREPILQMRPLAT